MSTLKYKEVLNKQESKLGTATQEGDERKSWHNGCEARQEND